MIQSWQDFVIVMMRMKKLHSEEIIWNSQALKTQKLGFVFHFKLLNKKLVRKQCHLNV